jgi:hypothetical protein
MIEKEDINEGDLVRIYDKRGGFEYGLVLAVYGGGRGTSKYHSSPWVDVRFTNGAESTVWLREIDKVMAKAK